MAVVWELLLISGLLIRFDAATAGHQAPICSGVCVGRGREVKNGWRRSASTSAEEATAATEYWQNESRAACRRRDERRYDKRTIVGNYSQPLTALTIQNREKTENQEVFPKQFSNNSQHSCFARTCRELSTIAAFSARPYPKHKGFREPGWEYFPNE
jgi:hypothetical protein